MPSDRPLWTCPECGQRFVSANAAHSCGTWTLDALFARALPIVRQTYDAFERMAREVAPFHVIPQKTRVSFQLRTRCAGGSPKRDHFQAGFIFRERVESPRFSEINDYGPGQIQHVAKLYTPEDVDKEVRHWIELSVPYGEQR